MGARRIEQADYDRMLAAFRASGSNYAAAARAAGVVEQTTKRAYEKGWPKKGMKPIQTVLLEDQAEARAKATADAAARQALKEKENADARQAAVDSKMQEGQMVKIARTSSLQALAMGGQLMQAGRKLVATIAPQIDAEVAKNIADQLPVAVKLNLLARAAQITESIVRLSMQTMQMERLHLGEPTDIIRHLDKASEEPMTVEMADLKIKAATQAMESFRRAKLVVLEGGMSTTSSAQLLTMGVDLELDATPAQVEDATVLDDDFNVVKSKAETA